MNNTIVYIADADSLRTKIMVNVRYDGEDSPIQNVGMFFNSSVGRQSAALVAANIAEAGGTVVLETKHTMSLETWLAKACRKLGSGVVVVEKVAA